MFYTPFSFSHVSTPSNLYFGTNAKKEEVAKLAEQAKSGDPDAIQKAETASDKGRLGARHLTLGQKHTLSFAARRGKNNSTD